MSKPELSDPITLRLPVDVLREIEAIAAATDRTRSWIMVRAMRLYLAREGKEIMQAVQGMEEIRNGNYYDADEVLREIEDIARGRVA